MRNGSAARNRPANSATAAPGDHTVVSFPPESAHDESAHLELRIWLRLLGCTARIENFLRARLREEFGISLARFDLLAQLERRPEGVSMSDVSRLLLVTNGAVTGLVDRLVDEGMVVREADADDRRTYIIKFTPSGRRAFAKMAKRHEEWVLSLLGELPGETKHQLLEHLISLKRRLEKSGY